MKTRFPLCAERTSKPAFVSDQKKERKSHYFSNVWMSTHHRHPFLLWASLFGALLSFFFFIFWDFTLTCKRSSVFPLGPGGPMRCLIPLSVFLMHSTQAAGPDTPITSKCLVGGKYFHSASNSHLVCRRFHTAKTHRLGSARLGSAWNWMRGQHAHRHDWEVAGKCFWLASN